MKRLKFDHIHKDKMFSFVEDYDAEKCMNIVINKCQHLANYFDMDFKYQRKIEIPQEIKYTDVYCTIEGQFISPKDTYDVKIIIPNIQNSFCLISGVKRYIQKQIIDTCFVSMSSQSMERVVCELELNFTLYKKNDVYYFSVRNNPHVEACATYLQLCEDLNIPEKLGDLANKDPIIADRYMSLKMVDKKQYIKLMEPGISEAQKRRILDYIKVYYHMSDILQEYFENPSDIILQMINKIEEIDNSVGLDLRTRRLRTIMDLVTSTIISQMIDFLMNVKYITHRKRKPKNIKIEPFQDLYNFVLVETMFNAPLASVANRARCTILGKSGFSKEGVPVRIKDIHPSQYNCLDPAVTPDRENAGVVLYLASTVKIDRLGRFEINNDFVEEVLRKYNTHI